MERKRIDSIITKIDEEQGIVEHIVAVMGNVDLGGDIIHPGAFTKTISERLGRIRVLDNHNTRSVMSAVGKPISMREVSRNDLPERIRKEFPDATGALKAVTQFLLNTPEGRGVFERLKSGAVDEWSIGYEPLDIDFSSREMPNGDEMTVRNLRTVKLYEYSPVLFAMNPATTTESVKASDDIKKAIAYHDYGKANEEMTWSAPTLSDFTGQTWNELSASEKRRIANHYTWSANMPPETFGDLKLPHHKPVTGGNGVAVWRGVSAAMGALLGARGGVDIPSGDRRAVYNHLKSHYAQFEKEAPEFKEIDENEFDFDIWREHYKSIEDFANAFNEYADQNDLKVKMNIIENLGGFEIPPEITKEILDTENEAGTDVDNDVDTPPTDEVNDIDDKTKLLRLRALRGVFDISLYSVDESLGG